MRSGCGRGCSVGRAWPAVVVALAGGLADGWPSAVRWAVGGGSRLWAGLCPPLPPPPAPAPSPHAPHMAPCARPCALHTARTSGFIGGAWVGPLRVTQWAGGDRRPHPRGRRTGPGGERRLPDRARFRNRARFTSTPGRRRPGLHEGRRRAGRRGGGEAGPARGPTRGARADARADARRGRTRGCTSSDTCGAARARVAPYERPPLGASVAPPSREADVALKRVRPPCERALPMPSATTSSSRGLLRARHRLQTRATRLARAASGPGADCARQPERKRYGPTWPPPRTPAALPHTASAPPLTPAHAAGLPTATGSRPRRNDPPTPPAPPPGVPHLLSSRYPPPPTPP